MMQSRLRRRGFPGTDCALLGTLRQRPDFAGEFSAFFDHQLSVADRAGYAAGRINNQLLTHRKFAAESAANFGDIDADGAGERTSLRDLNSPAIHGRFDMTF